MMRQYRILAVIFTFLLTVMSFAGCAGTDIKPQVIAFPDKNLETIIRNTLDKPSDEEILSTDLAKLKKLRIQNSNVFDLTGLEYCINLTFLEIRGAPVTDISPLSTLTKLSVADLVNNQISDISPLSMLTNLTILCLQDNEITDISTLSNLTNLTDLRLTQNNVDDISPLIENTGLGAEDSVLLGGNNLELHEGSEDMENIRTLENRGVIVSLDPWQWAPEKVSPGTPQPILMIHRLHHNRKNRSQSDLSP